MDSIGICLRSARKVLSICENQSMEIIKNNKGGAKACFEGFMYTRWYTSSDGATWRCIQRSTGCPGVLRSKETATPVLKRDHNHVSDEEMIGVAKCINTMKRKAVETSDKPAKIFAEAVEGSPNSVRSRLPREVNCKQAIQFQRQASMPAQPATLDDLELEGKWKLTGGNEGRNFLIHDNGTAAATRIIVYSSERQLQHLSSATTWFMDGNFSMSPPHFSQLYIIRAELGDTAVSCVYAFLQRKTKACYEDLLHAVLQKCRSVGFQPQPTKIIMDFEIAMIQAIQNKFEYGVHIQGCFYHLTQATWRKIQGLGLASFYKDNSEFRLFSGMLDCLALLPEADVRMGIAHLRRVCPGDPPAVLQLVEYFDTTYISGRRAANGRMLPPLIPPAIWNVHDATLNDEPRTNNQCEGWNNRFSQLSGRAHPSIWQAIRLLQQDEATTHTVFLQNDLGIPPAKRTKKKYIDLQTRLKNLCLDYITGRKNMEQFLQGAGRNIAVGRE